MRFASISVSNSLAGQVASALKKSDVPLRRAREVVSRGLQSSIIVTRAWVLSGPRGRSEPAGLPRGKVSNLRRATAKTINEIKDDRICHAPLP